MRIIKALLCGVFMSLGLTVSAQQREVVVECEWGNISATIDMPEEGSDTAVLIVAGSGPTDRNGNSGAGLNTYSYKMLGETLAHSGYAVMRYDKRGIGGSPIPAEDVPNLVCEDYIDDARACAKFLRAEGFERVIVAGHSEGGLIALQLAAEEACCLDGVVLLCAPGYNMAEILNFQLSQQLVPAYMGLMVKSTAIINSLKAGRMVAQEDIPAELMSLFHPTVQPFIISNMRYEPTELATKCRVPMLIVSGGRDIQVSVSNGERLHGANPAAEHRMFENMTHVLKDADTSDRMMQVMSIYTNANLAITEALAPAIVEFINNIK
jgi:alpha-beta hydrolase superfamily lysophospholipase